MDDLRNKILIGWIVVGVVGLILIIYTRPSNAPKQPLQYAESKEAAKNKPAAATPAPKQAAPVQQPTPAANLKQAIVGKWQIPGHAELDEFLEDGAFVFNNGKGGEINGRYKIVGGNKVMAIPDGANPMSAAMMGAEVFGDNLIMTSPREDGPATDHFVRVKPNGQLAELIVPPHGKIDQKSITGTWKSTGSDQSLKLMPDGTFIFGENTGNWEIVNNEIMVRDPANHLSWRLALSPDGRTLSGHFSNMRMGGGAAGAVTLTR